MMLWNSRNISLYQLRNKEANLSTREITGGNKIQYPNPVMPLTLQVSATSRPSDPSESEKDTIKSTRDCSILLSFPTLFATFQTGL